MAWTTLLPEDCHGEVGRPDDLEEMRALIERCEIADAGSSTVTVDELTVFMGEPGFDPANDVITVRSADGSLIAVGTFASRAPHVHTWSEGFVDPDHVGRGIGSALLSWAGDRATAAVGRAPEGARVTMAVGAHDHNERAKRLFTRNGFTLERYFLEMVIDLDGPITVQPVPDGITVRTIGADEGLEGLAVAVADSFRDHFGYTDQPLESRIARWEQWRTSELWDDDLVWIAEDDGRIVAMNVCISSNGAKQHEGYVATLGVLHDWRGRGLARALLTMSFAEFLRRGKSSVSLHVDADSITGATRLYEGVGMREVDRHVDFERELRPGEDLVVR